MTHEPLPELTPEMAERLRRLPAAVEAVAERLGAEFTPPVALVGGAVRDLLRGLAPGDLDLVVEGPLEPVAERLGGEIHRHARFSTATVRHGVTTIDIARARRETYACPGALPEIAPAPLEDDLLRRDFTVNAIALGLTGGRRGELLAAPRAAADLGARLLRVLHPASFADDPTRLLRLARYHARLGFAVEPQTLDRARAARRDGALGTVSGTRIGNELRLLAAEPDPLAAFAALRALELDSAIAPGLGVRDLELAARALGLLPQDGRADLLVLACALDGIPATERASLLDRLAFAAGERDRLLATASGAPGLAEALRRATRPSEVAAAAAGAPPEAVALAGALGAPAQARAWLRELREIRLAIRGDDLLAAGVPPGPAVGAGLRAALAAALDGHAPDRASQLCAALRAATPSG